MLKAALLALLLTLSFATAQSLEFHRSTTSGAYIYRLLDYAEFERIPCNQALIPLMPDGVQDYLCVRDTDAVPFETDVDSYLSIHPDEIADMVPWESNGDTRYRVIQFSDGYFLAILILNEEVMLMGQP